MAHPAFRPPLATSGMMEMGTAPGAPPLAARGRSHFRLQMSAVFAFLCVQSRPPFCPARVDYAPPGPELRRMTHANIDTPLPGDARLVALPSFSDPRGSIVIAEHGAALPFVPLRVRWIHGVAAGATRGGHAHRRTEQLFVAVH